MDVTGLTCFFIFTLIYLILLSSYSSSAGTRTRCPPGNVTVEVNSVSSVRYNIAVNITCNTSLPSDLINGFVWQENQNKIDGKNQSVLLQKIIKKVTFICTVLSPCGNFTSSPFAIEVIDQTSTILLICGVGAVIVILMFGITMKIMLKRGEAQRQARRQQRHVIQSNDSTATVTSYW